MRYPSIFNDVIGPVMRGPSSSHCAAALRIGRIARDLMDGQVEEVLIQIDPNGSLATTHKSHGSDLGLFAGLLGWDVTDERLPDSEQEVKKAGIKTKIEITDINASHPNTYKLTLKNSQEEHKIKAISSGGGIIEILEINGIKISIFGDYFETLLLHESDDESIVEYLKKNIIFDEINFFKATETSIIEIKSQKMLENNIIKEFTSKYKLQSIKQISPVLPILSRKNVKVPFTTCKQMMKYNKDKNLDLWELALQYESVRGNITKDEVFQKMREIALIMKSSIQHGLKGTEYKDRILGYQSGKFEEQMKNNRLLDGGILNRIILYTTTMMEVKSSMGIIVAAPTAGSCGTLPGTVIGTGGYLNLSCEEMTKAMLAAGMIGVLIATRTTFAAEVCGCQAECGAASGMAAAALVSLAQGTTKQAVDAASVALQNSLGMICDPVANRVEVPCLGKNVMAASNALVCANMALANFDVVIPLDEVIDTMDKVGKSLPHELRCTALGGLSITKSSKIIDKRLNL